MNHRSNPIFLSFGAGQWFGIALRISWFMPLLLAWVLLEFGWKLGAAIFAVMFVSVLLHEVGHILAANATDGAGDEIIMWPFGGLASVETSSPRSEVWTALAGPCVNLLLCIAFIPAAFWADSLPRALNPCFVPFDAVSDAARQTVAAKKLHEFGADLASDIQVLIFWFNWVCLLINLLPIYPLDGGRVCRVWLKQRMGIEAGNDFAIRVGIGSAVALLVVNLFFFQQIMVVTLAFGLILLAVVELFQSQTGAPEEDSFMGYDFSEGYKSLERTQPVEAPRKKSWWENWTSRRKAEKEKKLQEQAQANEQQIDAILAKVHEHGLASLTSAENRLLKKASHRYKSKGSEPTP